jgi:hypothetical protein
MNSERALGRLLRPTDVFPVPRVDVGQALRRTASGVKETVMKIVDPPYPTPDGKPLEIRFYEPGEKILLGPWHTQRLLRQMERLEKTPQP